MTTGYVRSKAYICQLNLRTGPKTKTSKMKKLITNGYAQKKRCRARNHGVSPEGGRKSRVEMICGTGRF